MKRIVVTTALVIATASLAACGNSATASNAPASGSTPGTATQSGSGNAAAGNRPIASGLIADIAGSTMQVQGTNSQIAVTWTGSTRITRTVAAALSDVTVGVCIQARQAPAATSSATTASAAPTSIGASSIAISAPVNGQCTAGGFGGAGGGFAGGGRTGTETGMPSGMPTGTATGRAGQGVRNGNGFGRTAFGVVTGVSGGAITIDEEFRSRGTSGTASPSVSPTTTAVTVTTTPSTAYTKQSSATAKDIAVGGCVTAIGTADTTGAITATTLSLRPAANGSCQVGSAGTRSTGTGGTNG